ncbi:RNA polymerase sigma factor SigJ [Rugosimonospora africana]|uniref:RNA polymerase sigma24 factor n=1 Tax=Rugosimonospora africana TaxID=556532 RepID=A0A8J3QYC8_9ACTN|nr:RNA polymerase sigma factor SigJ [Rugosimonospora africana]GIH18766.1 RNA polymerase sigma24 factor [Rugosimonospora africana]
MDQDQTAEELAAYRPRLLGVAYRLLGSAWDAEDIVEEATVRWLQLDRTDIREPLAFLTTMVTRLALDHLRSARVRRETYYGPWLPEPVLTGNSALGPLETVEQRDSLSMATMRLLEQLTPPERGVFVLRSAFELPYEDIAEVLDMTAEHARQLHHRAQARIASGASRFDADTRRHAFLFESLVTATQSGDLSDLEQLLAADVVAYNDGGGKVRAALNPVTGVDNVLRFIAGLRARFDAATDVRFVEVNGQPAAYLRMGDQEQVVGIGVREGRIAEIFAVLNPDKTRYARTQLGAPDAEPPRPAEVDWSGSSRGVRRAEPDQSESRGRRPPLSVQD